MADDGEDAKPRKLIRRTACFSPMEDALLLTRVQLAGVSISAFLKSSALDFPLPRAARRPTVNHQMAVRLLAEVGRLRMAFFNAAASADGVDPRILETAAHDFAETRLVLLESLGRAP